FDGASWTACPSGVREMLLAIAGIPRGDPWAAGARGVILHYTGGAWTPVPSTTPNAIYGLLVDGPNAIRAFTNNGPNLIFDGKSWSAAPRGSERARFDLFAVWSIDSGRRMALDCCGTIYSFDGKKWSKAGGGGV